MAIAETYTGTATITATETSLVSGTTVLQSVATPAVVQVLIDVANMAAGDEYQIMIKDKVISSGVQRTIYNATLDGSQSGPFVTPSIILYHGWDVTMDLIVGTARSISWSIRTVA